MVRHPAAAGSARLLPVAVPAVPEPGCALPGAPPGVAGVGGRPAANPAAHQCGQAPGGPCQVGGRGP